jgi:two-component system OmpR family sensor kinase
VMAFAVDRGRDDLVRVAFIYLLASLGSLILVGVVGWLVAGRLLKPLRTLRENSQRINETDLTERIPVQGNDDISELTRTYNQMLDRLQIAIDTQRRFLDDAGHELRTPLTILRGQLEVLDPADPFDVTETRLLLLDEIDRMGRMVEELILLSKAQRPDFLVLRSIDLAPFTDDLLDKAQSLGDRDWSLHERGDAQFVGDAHRLTQAMMELALNAVKFSAVGSAISIGSRATPGEVRLWVSDAGMGVRPDELNRLFERFSRASSGLGVEGSGLGLSIVEAIATAHLGRVELESEPGVGSTFTIVLPQPDAALRSASAHRDLTRSPP